MKLLYIPIIIFIFSLTSYGQQITFISTLDESVKESSGLIYLNGKLITHNDSGGEPALYELDTLSGNVTREVVVSNALNKDWEDICHDDKYIYIADIGNNKGNREDLRIYRILISDYLTTGNDTVMADTFNLIYKNQTDFYSALYSTNFDAEALISYKDLLYIFTKNWGDFMTNIYPVPKIPGTYQIEKIDSINSHGLITSATCDTLTNTILLTGYTVDTAFIMEIKDFTDNHFSTGTINRYPLIIPSGYSYQIESIAPVNKDQYFMTAEKSKTGNSALYKLQTGIVSDIDEMEKTNIFIYPNPATDTILINDDDLLIVDIYDFEGKLLKRTRSNKIDISNLAKGIYTVIVEHKTSNKVITRKLVIR